MRHEAQATERPRPPIQATPSTPSSTALLAFDDGTVVEADGVCLIGRQPVPAAGETADLIVAIQDFSRSVSRTHARVRWDGYVLWVLDRGSANGTVVTDTTRAVHQAGPVEEVPATPGARVSLGERYFIVVRGDHRGARP